MRTLRLVLALGAFFVGAIAVAACGGDLPGNAVARVGDSTITNADFQHWLRIAAISSQSQVPGQTGAVAVPDPPDFTNCVAQKRKTAPKPAKGQPAPTDAQFRAECQQEYVALRDQVMQFLITAQWFEGEAAQEGITVSAKDVDKQFQQTKQQQFPTPQALARFLKTSGYTIPDIRFRIRLGLLQNKLRDRIVKGKDRVTPQQIANYYNQHKDQFGQPERRDVLLILTKTQGAAQAALKQLHSGKKFADVAKRFSVDPQSKAQGGLIPGATKQGGPLEPQLADAVFSAPQGKLNGPLKTQFGWYLYEVKKITPASQQTLAQATPTIRSTLASQAQQNALNSFIKDFRKKWRDMTVCRKSFLSATLSADCGNAPQPKASSSSSSSGGTPPTTTG